MIADEVKKEFIDFLTDSGLSPCVSTWSTTIPIGSSQFEAINPDITGLLLFLKNAGSYYDIFGGTGFGDALHLVDGRFDFAKLSTPGWAVSPFEIKHKPKPVCLIGAKISRNSIGFFVDGVLQQSDSTDEAVRYQNPYNININHTGDVLLAATLTSKFKAENAARLSQLAKDYLLSTGAIMPIPKPQLVTQYLVQ